MKSLTDMDQIAIGFIRTTHGVKGALKVESFSGERDHFLDLKQITLKSKGRSRVFSVEKISPFGKGLLIKLQGLDNPESGKAFSGWEIWVDRQSAAPLNKGEFYQTDLCGCNLLFEGSGVGTVLSIVQGGNGDLLEIELNGAKETRLIPFIKEFIGDVDIEKKTIELLKDWVLE